MAQVAKMKELRGKGKVIFRELLARPMDTRADVLALVVATAKAIGTQELPDCRGEQIKGFCRVALTALGKDNAGRKAKAPEVAGPIAAGPGQSQPSQSPMDMLDEWAPSIGSQGTDEPETRSTPDDTTSQEDDFDL